MGRRKDPEDLTADERSLLAVGTSSLVREFVSETEFHGARAAAFRKVANAATTEFDALMAVGNLQAIRAEMSGRASALERAKALETENTGLRAELESTRSRLEQETARTAMAVHSEGTQR